MKRINLPGWPPAIRRRWLLGALSGAGWWAWLAQQDALAAPRRLGQRATRGKQAPAAWPHLLDHLIPADDWSPAATGLKVDSQLWAEVQKDAAYEQLVVYGCQWLDRYHPQGFAKLSEAEREELLTWMSQAPWESPQRRFFDLVRDHAMTIYYLQPAARQGTLLEHPPQPGGRAINLPPLPKLGGRDA
jgi:Gluconate 2-dehydrogenase subunit 3